MIYVKIDGILKAYYKAFGDGALVPGHGDEWVQERVKQLEVKNNCKIKGGKDFGGMDCIDGIEFPDEQTYMLFLLRWS